MSDVIGTDQLSPSKAAVWQHLNVPHRTFQQQSDGLEIEFVIRSSFASEPCSGRRQVNDHGPDNQPRTFSPK